MKKKIGKTKRDMWRLVRIGQEKQAKKKKFI